jgi:hypothetical protein
MVAAMAALTGYAVFWALREGDAVSFALLAAFVVIDIVIVRMARYSFGSVTTAAPDGVRVGRGRRAVTVPWHAIASCTAGDRGTSIDCFDGRRLLAAAPQHANVKRGAHTKTKADYAALYITERARMFRQAHPAPSTGEHARESSADSEALDDAVVARTGAGATEAAPVAAETAEAADGPRPGSLEDSDATAGE